MYVFFPNKEYKFLLFYDTLTDNTQRVEKYKTELHISPPFGYYHQKTFTASVPELPGPLPEALPGVSRESFPQES